MAGGLAGRASGIPSFATRIIPVLTKAGCNSGACHGAATGQGGFRLSLLGYDPDEDYAQITRALGGRRVDLSEPSRSLLLRKPSLDLDHDGGRKLARDSAGYAQVLSWLEAGAPRGPRDSRVVGLDVEPRELLLEPGSPRVSIRVMARLSGGAVEEVTPWALFSTNDDAVADVDRQGRVEVRGRGSTAVVVRHGGQVAAVPVAVPSPSGAGEFAGFPVQNVVDELVLEALKRLRLPPSPVCDAPTFLRRVHLDLLGRLPTAGEARDFQTNGELPEVRARKVDELLGRPEFVDFWTLRLGDLLQVGGRRSEGEAAGRYHDWLRSQVAMNRSWDAMARDLLTALGRLTEVGPAGFLASSMDPRDLGERVGRIFLGLQIGCARCHAHPTDRWTRSDYHQFAAHFAGVTVVDGRLKRHPRGEVEDPATGLPAVPRPLGGGGGSVSGNVDAREDLADWMLDPGNPYFARAFVNRVWRHLTGRGLVEPVDDLRPTNPAALPGLLDRLAADFAAGGFDLRSLIRRIATSSVYQLASTGTPMNRADDRHGSHGRIRPLPAQVLADVVAQVTGNPDTYAGAAPGTRAVQLVGTSTPSYALDVLGRCSRERDCEGPASAGGGLAQALHLLNGTTINDKLEGGIVEELLASGATLSGQVDEVYWRAYSRPPSVEERDVGVRWLESVTDRRRAMRDLVWAILNSREFGVNH